MIQAFLDQEMELLAAGKACAFFWEAPSLAVVMGIGGKPERETHELACRDDGIPVLKRRSGGGTVLLGPGVLCWGVVLPPRDCLCDPKGLAGEVLPFLCDGLRMLNLPVMIQGLGDLAIGAKKICGTAQKWTRDGIMIHGSILVNLDLTLISQYLPHPPLEPDYRSGREHHAFLTTLSAELQRPFSVSEAAAVLTPELEALTGLTPRWLSR